MLRKAIILCTSTLLAFSASAAPSVASGSDVSPAFQELSAAAVATRELATHGMTSHGSLENEGLMVSDVVVDGGGHSRQVSHSTGEDQISYSAAGIGYWNLILSKRLQMYASGLAYIGKPGANYEFTADAEATDGSGGLSGAAPVEELIASRYTFLTADTTDEGSGRRTYTLTGQIDPAQVTTWTIRLTNGAVTNYRAVTELADGSGYLDFERTWSYGEQAPITLPTQARSTTVDEMVKAYSALRLPATVKAHAREIAKAAKGIARKAKRTKVLAADVRTAAPRVLEYYQETQGHPEDALPTRAVKLTGGVALHATDPFKHKVRIATVQAIKGKVVVSL
jgi:hypothetical protein